MLWPLGAVDRPSSSCRAGQLAGARRIDDRISADSARLFGVDAPLPLSCVKGGARLSRNKSRKRGAAWAEDCGTGGGWTKNAG